MVKIGRKLGITIIAGLPLAIGVLVLAPVACTSSRDVVNLSTIDLTDKGNPKLDSHLNQLIKAEESGETVSFAQQHGIELVDEKVRVIIECVPGQIGAALKAATDASATLETSHDNLLQVVMPVVNLTDLAGEESIKFIRLPQIPLSGAE